MPTVIEHHIPGSSVKGFLIETQALPTVETTIIEGDADIISISIANAGGQASPKFTIKDKQSTPRTFIFGANTKVVAEGSVHFGPGPGKRAIGGLTWIQDTAGALEGSIEYRRP